MKKCPYCAEKIQEDAVFCRHCHKDLALATNLDLVYPTDQLQTPPKKKLTGRIWLIIGLVFGLIVLIAIISRYIDPEVAMFTPMLTATNLPTKSPTATPEPVTLKSYAKTILPYVNKIYANYQLIVDLLVNIEVDQVEDPAWQDKLFTAFDEVYTDTKAMVDEERPEGFDQGHTYLENALSEWDKARNDIHDFVFNIDAPKAIEVIQHASNFNNWIILVSEELNQLNSQ